MAQLASSTVHGNLKVIGDSQVAGNLNVTGGGDVRGPIRGGPQNVISSRYNNTPIINDHMNSNISLNASGGSVHLGNMNTTSVVFDAPVSVIPTSGSSGTWTSVNMSGSKGGYAGIHFTDYSRFFMVNASIQGFHTGSAWQWYFSNGILTTGTVPWANLSNVPTYLARSRWGSAVPSPAAGDMYFT